MHFSSLQFRHPGCECGHEEDLNDDAIDESVDDKRSKVMSVRKFLEQIEKRAGY